MLQDAHIHLHDSGVEAGHILAGARSQGVGRFFCNSASPRDWPEVKALAGAHKNVIPFFGIHPWHAGEAVEGWDVELIKHLTIPGACIGEIGLDAAKKNIEFEIQREVFARQLDIAAEFKKPFAVHCVQSWDILLKEIGARRKNMPAFMVHWFSGSPEIAAELIKMGGYIS
ncbi:MAG: TatD family hydrolase, partial [Candidatus Omnitrophota bacterium]